MNDAFDRLATFGLHVYNSFVVAAAAVEVGVRLSSQLWRRQHFAAAVAAVV